MNILAIGAHPDDIEIGCGGTLIKYALQGHNVCLFIVSDGGMGGDPLIRRKEQKRAAAFMKARKVFWGDLNDTEIKSDRPLIMKIESALHSVKADIVFINYHHDVHQDHRGTSQAAISATRYVKEVLFYETPTTYNFEPQIFVDIRDVFKKKTRLLELHASQVHKTRVKDLAITEIARSTANFRGFQGRVKYAEGFMALRLIREIS